MFNKELEELKNKDLEELKNKQTEMNNTITEMKTTLDLTNEEERGSLPEKEFRIMIVKMIQNLGNRMEKIQETFSKDLEEVKSK